MKRIAAIIGVIACTALGSAPFALRAQVDTGAPGAGTASAPETDETLTLRVGDVFEIAADPGDSGATHSWILTQDRSFIEAMREPVFRYRFVQDKRYTLRADVHFAATGERRQRTFTIDVLPNDASTPPAVTYPAGTGASLAGTIPAPDTNGRVVLSDAVHVVQLTPIRTDLSPVAVDFDAARDTDGDGNAGNDIDNAGTYFHSFGRPLWIWMARPITEVEIVITAVPTGASPSIQRITVMNEETARTQGVLTSAVNITASRIDDATYGFTPALVRPIAGDSPLLYEWDFGDGNRSLETEPVHVYATGGTYTVALHVRDLGTGNTVGRTETTVSPVVTETPPIEPDPLPPDEPDPTPPEEEVPPTEVSAVPWSRILLFGGIFGLSLLIGLAIVWLLSFLRKSRRLEQTLESMEQAIVPPKEQAPAPLAIKSKPQAAPTSAQQKIIDAELNAASSQKTTPPPVNEAAAPDWLKKGLSPEKTTPTPASTPAAPTPLKTAPTAPPAPKPAPAAQTPAVDPSKLPHWLQPANPAQPTPAVPSAATPVKKPVEPPVIPATAKPAAPAVAIENKTAPDPTASIPSVQATPPAPTAAPATPKPATVPPTVTPPKPAAPVPVRPTPIPAPSPTPVPAPPKPAPSAPAPVANTPPAAKQAPAQPSVAPPTLPMTPPKPLTAPTAPNQSIQPGAIPVPTAPASTASIPSAASPTPRQAPVQVTPPPVLPTSAPTPPQKPVAQNDDDRPIAIIRAESIDTGPKN